MDLKAAIAKNIRRLREAKGLTQEQLAKACEKTVRYVSHLENSGEQNVTVDTLSHFAHALGCTVQDLMVESTAQGEKTAAGQRQVKGRPRLPAPPKAAAVGLDLAIRELKDLRRRIG